MGMGANWAGKLGLNDTADRSSPTQIPGTWTSATAGSGNDGRGVKSDGTLWVWGTNQEGVLGLNNVNPGNQRSSPTQVGTDTNWKQIVSGSARSQAMKTDGSLWGWGGHYAGASMLYGSASKSSPVQIGTGTDWAEKEFSTGSNAHAWAMKTDGTLWSWGRNFRGQLGHNDLVEKSSPTQIPGTNWIDCYTSTQGGAAFLRSSS